MVYYECVIITFRKNLSLLNESSYLKFLYLENNIQRQSKSD